MGFSLRKSVRFGPFRFNLSGAGIGASVGVPGLRVGTGPRGGYVSVSSHGLTYRTSLGGQTRRAQPRPVAPFQLRPVAETPAPEHSGMTEITSGDVLEMVDSSANDLLDSLNDRAGRWPWLALFLLLTSVCLMCAGAGALDASKPEPSPSEARAPVVAAPSVPTYTVRKGDTLTSIGRKHDVSVAQLRTWNGLTTDVLETGQILTLAPAPPSELSTAEVDTPAPPVYSPWALAKSVLLLFGSCITFLGAGFAWWRHRVRSTTVLLYDLDAEAEGKLTALYAALEGLSSCTRLWHIAAHGAVNDWKRNAGATRLLTRSVVRISSGDAPRIRTNAVVAGLPAGREVLYFMPDRLLVYDTRSARYGAVAYGDVQVETGASSFIESEGVPRDAAVIGHTWEKVNRNGGPDRRFKNNRQLPVCRYGDLIVQSNSGLMEKFQFSRVGAADGLLTAIRAMDARIKPLPRADTVAAPSAPRTATSTSAGPPPASGANALANQTAGALACLLKYVAVADRKFTPEERTAIRSAMLEAFPGDPWVHANVDSLIDLVTPRAADLPVYLGYFTPFGLEQRKRLFEAASSIAMADGRATPKERERLEELRVGLGLL